MKKLMIAAAIVCAAAMSQAAGFNWNVKTSGDSLYNLDGTKFAGTAYVFAGDNDAAAVSAAFDILIAGGDLTTAEGYAGSLTFAAGETSSQFSYGTDAGKTYDFTMLVKGNDGNYLVADAWTDKEPSAQAAGADIPAYLDWTADAEQREEYTWGPASEGYMGSGYYTGAVPEPTSGLLLLLGVAGMALRRRRA